MSGNFWLFLAANLSCFDWLLGCFDGYLVGSLAGWLIVWLVEDLVGWLVGGAQQRTWGPHSGLGWVGSHFDSLKAMRVPRPHICKSQGLQGTTELQSIFLAGV